MGSPLLSSATAELFVVDVVAQHDPQPDAELASGRHFGFAKTLLRQAECSCCWMLMRTAPQKGSLLGASNSATQGKIMLPSPASIT
jgi:hypothetical protein